MARDCVRLDASLPDAVSADAIQTIVGGALRCGVPPGQRFAWLESLARSAAPDGLVISPPHL